MSNINYNTKYNKSANEHIEKIIKSKVNNEYSEILTNDIELERELELKTSNKLNQPKNHGNIWSDYERQIILNYMKKNNYVNNPNLYDDIIIQKIAKKIERSEYGIQEEIKKMIFNDYIGELNTYEKLSLKYNIPEYCIKILVKIYLEKYSKNILNQFEIENKILKYKLENIKLKAEIKELSNKIL